jgi:hypothetical protein
VKRQENAKDNCDDDSLTYLAGMMILLNIRSAKGTRRDFFPRRESTTRKKMREQRAIYNHDRFCSEIERRRPKSMTVRSSYNSRSQIEIG